MGKPKRLAHPSSYRNTLFNALKLPKDLYDILHRFFNRCNMSIVYNSDDSCFSINPSNESLISSNTPARDDQTKMVPASLSYR